MAVLHSEEKIFYHPLDSFVDGDGVTWTTPDEGALFEEGSMTFAATGKIDDAMASFASPPIGMGSLSYGSVPGITRFTVAFWMKSNGVSELHIGFNGNSGGSFASMQAIHLFSNGTIRLFHGDGSTVLAGNIFISSSEYHLYVFDISIDGSGFVLRDSLDGGPFTVRGSVGSLTITNSPTAGLIASKLMKIDEVVVWRNLADPFTSAELSNLFDLADDLGLAMDKYNLNFGIVISGSSNMFIEGHGFSSSSTDMFIPSKAFISGSNNMFMDGSEFQVSSIGLFTDGFKIKETVPAPSLFIEGHTNEVISGDMFIDGSELQVASMGLFIGGFTIQETISIPSLFIEGHTDEAVSGDMFIHGSELHVASIGLFVGGFKIKETVPLPSLFIEGHTGEAVSVAMFIVGPKLNVASIGLFIGGLKIKETTSPPTFFIEGHIPKDVSVEMFMTGPKLSTASVNMFSCGLGHNATFTTLFINGLEPKPVLACPELDPTASIQIKDSLIRIYQARIDALINQLGKNVLLEFDPIRTPCPNCTFDNIRKRSTGIFIPGGPRPFKRGRKCPWCKGRGLLETPVTKCIKCLIKWNPKDAVDFGISISQKKGIVRLKTFLIEADDLIRAKTVIANFDIINQMKLRVRLIQGPIPVGLREDRYCISFWELV